MATRKTKQMSYGSSSVLNRPSPLSFGSSPTNNISGPTEKKISINSPKITQDRQNLNQQSRIRNLQTTEKASVTNLSSILSLNKSPISTSQIPVSGRSSSFNNIKVNHLSLNTFARFH